MVEEADGNKCKTERWRNMINVTEPKHPGLIFQVRLEHLDDLARQAMIVSAHNNNNTKYMKQIKDFDFNNC